MSDQDHDYRGDALAEHAESSRRLQDAMHGDCGSDDRTADQIEQDERAAIARALRMEKPKDDGNVVVLEALGEELTPAQGKKIAELLRAPYAENGVEPDHAEIGRIVAGVVVAYARKVATTRGLL